MSIKTNKQTYQVFRAQTLEGIPPYKNIKNCTLMMRNFCSFWRKMVLKNLFALLGYCNFFMLPCKRVAKRLQTTGKHTGIISIWNIFSEGTIHIEPKWRIPFWNNRVYYGTSLHFTNTKKLYKNCVPQKSIMWFEILVQNSKSVRCTLLDALYLEASLHH